AHTYWGGKVLGVQMRVEVGVDPQSSGPARVRVSRQSSHMGKHGPGAHHDEAWRSVRHRQKSADKLA
ncbi:unnamed protein product, partial [Lota lota]